jgi:hypothetical protein
MWFVFQGLIIAFGFLIFSQTFDGRLVAVKSFPTQISPVLCCNGHRCRTSALG